MNKKTVIIPVVVIIVIFVIVSSLEPSEKNDSVIFHVTLADPGLYINGVYTDTFTINQGKYSFRFVPNGSSPDILSITLNGKNFNFSEDFNLEGTLQQTGASEYFTWEYKGEETIWIAEMQEVSIVINPNGNVMGSVSVDILKSPLGPD